MKSDRIKHFLANLQILNEYALAHFFFAKKDDCQEIIQLQVKANIKEL